MIHNAASLLIILLVLLVGSACTTSTTYMTHPQTLEQGDVQGSIAAQGDLNTAPFTQTIEAARASEDRVSDQYGERMSEEEARELLDSAVAWALLRPTMSQELAMRVGLIEGFDAGMRYNGSTLKGDLKVRLWQSDDELSALSLTVGAGRQSGGAGLLEYLALSDFSRWDGDVALMYGGQPSKYLRTFIGPRLLHSWINVEPKLSDDFRERLPEEYQDYEPSQFFRDENVLMFGGTGGLMIGKDPVWLVLEGTVMRSKFEPYILDERRDMSGWLIAPAAGLLVEL